MDDKTYQEGLRIRREVVGDEYVDAALAKAGDLGAPLQDLVTEYCWGAVWGRPGLERRTRSLINIAMISALNRPNELRAHIRGAVRNGCSHEEIREVLVQVAAYCGFPAALDGFKIAQEVFGQR
ncbi:4-carboxymuconolactone decarboxylase [Amycolatopsis acidicola]|uniref:4-carboxymuconolactone decarboxylase n=1 Tax=Amycolatopsis acidicola TaxID=2596893 RepID=A0A5N0UNC3_9PSEU|nr:carboxymuconolactone decarboxylase family protein [Amycolatopsis acidicola]KAA9149533.1 4-carboxymuconolactone decarboxylase [Amycolatopsis acidicola]